MTKKDMEIARKQINSIQEYRKVLSQILHHPITLDQAIADWFEHGYHRGTLANNPTSHSIQTGVQ